LFDESKIAERISHDCQIRTNPISRHFPFFLQENQSREPRLLAGTVNAYVLFTTIILAVILWSPVLLAFQAPDLKIVLNADNSGGKLGPDAKAILKDWKKLCKNLGNRLKIGQGPFGFGMFANYSCAGVGEKLENNSEWQLEVKIVHQDVSFIITKMSKIEARQNLRGTVSVLRYLSDPGFSDALAFGLARSLPVLLNVVQGTQSKGMFSRGTAISDATKVAAARFDPPAELVLLHLSYDLPLKVWIPESLGTASLRYYDKAKYSQTEEGKSNGRVFWDATFTRKPKQGGLIWAQAIEGRGRFLEDEAANARVQNAYDALEIKYGKRKSTLFGSVSSFLIDSASSGYVGARYGKQFLAGDSLLGNTSFQGLLIEIRSGPLDGLRFYYDEVPTVRQEIESVKVYLGWSRITAGMSFGLYPGFLVDKIDIVPKVGIWNFSGLLPIQTSTGLLTQEFKVKNGLSLALEAGLEWIGSWYTIRSWASQDQSLVLGKIDTSGVATTRVGLDTFLSAGPTINVFSAKLKTTFLLFVVLESIKLRAAKGTVQETQRFRIDEVDFDSGYAGGGLVISW
jgi:hypothetical protein